MDESVALQEFERLGYGVFAADDRGPLDELRRQIYAKACEIFGLKGGDPERDFNHFHELAITGVKLNELRVKLIREVTDSIDSGTLIYRAFHKTIESLLGPDLLVQKNTNLVIQQPGDPNPSELHRDAPANSPYEVVVWLPLVDCFRTKSMYIVNREKTAAALAKLSAAPDEWNEFHDHCVSVADNVDAPYGTALFFWTGLFHGSRINQEKETRFSLNMRYKGLFSPNGLKEPFEFFKIFKTSPMSRMGLAFQRGEVLR
jgi:sporadic carbohydrate cluster 2OG-Fe(II) oxygenase